MATAPSRCDATARRSASFTISSIPSGRPTIALIERPAPNLSGSLTLHYKLADRYGVASAEAEFAKPAGADAKPAPRALIEAPKLPLQLPCGGERPRRGEDDKRPLRASLGRRARS